MAFTAIDRVLEALAQKQYGLISRAQALSAGLTARAIEHRLKSGRWIAIHPEVYAISGSPSSWFRDEMAACLWARDGLASHRAAGFLYELPGCKEPPIEIRSTRTKVVPRSGVIVHHTKWLPPDQRHRMVGIPCTSIDRTLLDLGAVWRPRQVAIALDNALRRGLTTLGAIDWCLYLSARRGRDGCAVLRELMKKRLQLDELPTTPLETVVFELLEGSWLPMPEIQPTIVDERGEFVAQPDFLYREEKLVIEAHSREWHWGEHAYSSDATRHNRLTALGHQVVYVTYADATRNAQQTLELIDRLLEERRRSLKSA
jgi:hypothetical protein